MLTLRACCNVDSGVAALPVLAAAPTHYEATLESLNRHPLPAWYADAKLGIFVHWGLYSVPGWAHLFIPTMTSKTRNTSRIIPMLSGISTLWASRDRPLRHTIANITAQISITTISLPSSIRKSKSGTLILGPKCFTMPARAT
jgi:hypothetical protein